MKRARWIPFAIAAWALVACAGTNPASAPAPLTEVPLNLRFPQNLSAQADLGTVTASGNAALKAMVMEGDDISDEISDTANNFQIFSGLVDEILEPLHQLLIPRSVDVTRFEGLIILEDRLVNVKIDFQPFDENNDGVKENCSGHTAALPICYRIWFDGKRALAGIFQSVFPTDDNPGDGHFRGLSPVKILGVIPFATQVVYDVRDPEDKHLEYFLATPREVEEGTQFEQPPRDFSEIGAAAHLLFSQLGANDTAVKTILGSIEGDGAEERHLGRWREGEDLWSGSRDLAGSDLDFTAACANISSGLVINPSFCVDAGIDVTGIDFLDFLEIADLAFPDDFPVSPTF